MLSPGIRVNRVPTPLRGRVVERLRSAINEQVFPQGSRLIERQLCEMLGVSRTPVREALRQLEAEGLVVTVANRGPSVAVLDGAIVRSIFEVRAMLEALAGRLFVERATDRDRRRLTDAFALLEQAWAEDDAYVVLRATADFYDVLFAGSGNEVIAATLRPLSGRIYLLRARNFAIPGRRLESIVEMRAILEAARGSDPSVAWCACLTHVQKAARSALDNFAAPPTGAPHVITKPQGMSAHRDSGRNAERSAFP
ncbi:MAG: GntR family transcriptional regulator [Acetobacteraceae bacterium]|nr:GntR family transcriptional regulator [Acetobacteraceae bacterium]